MISRLLDLKKKARSFKKEFVLYLTIKVVVQQTKFCDSIAKIGGKIWQSYSRSDSIGKLFLEIVTLSH